MCLKLAIETLEQEGKLSMICILQILSSKLTLGNYPKLLLILRRTMFPWG